MTESQIALYFKAMKRQLNDKLEDILPEHLLEKIRGSWDTASSFIEELDFSILSWIKKILKFFKEKVLEKIPKKDRDLRDKVVFLFSVIHVVITCGQLFLMFTV